MFEPSTAPRIFATPLGVDFCADLIAGISDRLDGQGPEALARVDVLVANARMQRRLQALYMERGPGLLPRIRPVLALSDTANLEGLPPAKSPLEVRLELSQLIAQLIDANPDLAPRAALYDLADSLADFMGEMAEEGITPAQITALDMGGHSEHWSRARAFLQITSDMLAQDDRLIPEARQALVVDRLIAKWQHTPPMHPVIVAGSTGSRRATFRLMQAVASLPQGAVILPGLDTDLPRPVWRRLLDDRRRELSGEDHPQFRLARVLDEARIDPADVLLWTQSQPANAARNTAVSLALRPAPVTNQWRTEGPNLPDIARAMADVSLIEAPSPQAEATAIALRLRAAIERGERAALVTPDRRLARKVTAQLDRWRILPDDSAGQVLAQTAPGRFLRQVAEALSAPITAEALIALLKHPLCHSGTDRRKHTLRVNTLELRLLRRGLAFPTPEAVLSWAHDQDDDAMIPWAEWLTPLLAEKHSDGPRPIADHVAAHVELARHLACEPSAEGSGELYDQEPGQEAARLMADLAADAPHGGLMSARDYADFFTALAHDREVRFALRPHADILIWGTQEARVQGADITILAGLNEGTWPGAAEADPWLNRPLRAEAGLRLPDRVIGLSAHDFQQGIAGGAIWLSRAKRDDETDTVPARWLNRMVNLLDGASPASAQALEDMRARGDAWLAQVSHLTQPEAFEKPAPRPAPAPQSGPRLTELSVTEVEKLIRDPYAIYAKRILKLQPIEPLRASPDARLRGNVVHAILDAFVDETRAGLPDGANDIFMDIATQILLEEAPWPAARQFWDARLRRVLPWYLAEEAKLRALAEPWMLEQKKHWDIPGLDLRLTGKGDRIDRLPDGRVAIYDYKTGNLPSDKQEIAYNKQLLIEGLMARGGAFSDTPLEVAKLTYIGLGSTPDIRDQPVDDETFAQILAGLKTLITHYRLRAVGFPSRRSVKQTRFDGDYDHLARLGEWDETQEAKVIPVGGDADG
ncbi:double-strand break repair protein AddB [Gymnodinialimonas ulvae]|uniref:double-strand break repair protein AddB n=1 Tax=Gymnodinialimonas ulvae TaxID=3126504 RepID=UPI00309D3E05